MNTLSLQQGNAHTMEILSTHYLFVTINIKLFINSTSCENSY